MEQPKGNNTGTNACPLSRDSFRPAGMPRSNFPAFAAAMLAGAVCLSSSSFSFAESKPLSMSDEFVAFGYGREHGLPDDEVRDILQTHDGYL